MITPRRRSRWTLLWYPVIAVAMINLLMQLVISWHQAGLLFHARPGSLLMAVLNQLATYVMLIPAMQQFFATAGVRLGLRQTFALLSSGMALGRVLPAGDYVLWRSYFRHYRGGIGAATHWEVLLYTGLFSSLGVIFVTSQVLTLGLYPNVHAPSLLGDLRFLPTGVIVVLLLALLLARTPRFREMIARFAADKLGSRTLSPVGIVRVRQLGVEMLGALALGTLFVWLLEAFTMVLCMRAVGLVIPPVIAVFGFAFAKVFTYLPITPGGIGEVETAASLFFAAFGFPVFPILTGTVLYRLITYWAPLFFGGMMYGLLRKRQTFGSRALSAPVFAASLHQR